MRNRDMGWSALLNLDSWLAAGVHAGMQNTAMARRWHDLTGHTVNPPQRAVKEDAQRKESAAQAYVTLYKRGPTQGVHTAETALRPANSLP